MFQRGSSFYTTETKRRIKVGGAGTLISGASERSTKDLDFAAGQEAMNAFLEIVQAQLNGFKHDDDGSIIFWSSLGFFVPVDLLILGGDFVESVNAFQQMIMVLLHQCAISCT